MLLKGEIGWLKLGLGIVSLKLLVGGMEAIIGRETTHTTGGARSYAYIIGMSNPSIVV